MISLNVFTCLLPSCLGHIEYCITGAQKTESRKLMTVHRLVKKLTNSWHIGGLKRFKTPYSNVGWISASHPVSEQ